MFAPTLPCAVASYLMRLAPSKSKVITGGSVETAASAPDRSARRRTWAMGAMRQDHARQVSCRILSDKNDTPPERLGQAFWGPLIQTIGEGQRCISISQTVTTGVGAGNYPLGSQPSFFGAWYVCLPNLCCCFMPGCTTPVLPGLFVGSYSSAYYKASMKRLYKRLFSKLGILVQQARSTWLKLR